MTFSKERNFEREAVADERVLLRDALKRSTGEATLSEVKAEFAARIQGTLYGKGCHRSQEWPTIQQ